MQAQAYEGYFENGLFYSSGQTIKLPERRRVYITVIDEPVDINNTEKKPDSELLKNTQSLAIESAQEDLELRAAWLKKLNAAIDLSLNEEFPFLHRSPLMRDPISFSE